MQVQKYIKMILYKVSLDHEVNLTTIERYTSGEYKRTIILTIDGEKKYFSNLYMLLDFLTGYIGGR